MVGSSEDWGKYVSCLSPGIWCFYSHPEFLTSWCFYSSLQLCLLFNMDCFLCVFVWCLCPFLGLLLWLIPLRLSSKNGESIHSYFTVIVGEVFYFYHHCDSSCRIFIGNLPDWRCPWPQVFEYSLITKEHPDTHFHCVCRWQVFMGTSCSYLFFQILFERFV